MYRIFALNTIIKIFLKQVTTMHQHGHCLHASVLHVPLVHKLPPKRNRSSRSVSCGQGKSQITIPASRRHFANSCDSFSHRLKSNRASWSRLSRCCTPVSTLKYQRRHQSPTRNRPWILCSTRTFCCRRSVSMWPLIIRTRTSSKRVTW